MHHKPLTMHRGANQATRQNGDERCGFHKVSHSQSTDASVASGQWDGKALLPSKDQNPLVTPSARSCETGSVLRGLPNGCLGPLKADPGVRAVTERFGGRSAAATKRDPFFDGIKAPISVFQFHRAVHDQRPVPNDFNGDFRHSVSCSISGDDGRRNSRDGCGRRRWSACRPRLIPVRKAPCTDTGSLPTSDAEFSGP
jgi:hypothetical protein